MDTFGRAYIHRRRLRTDVSPLPWLHKVALNLCYSRLGRRRLRERAGHRPRGGAPGGRDGGARRQRRVGGAAGHRARGDRRAVREAPGGGDPVLPRGPLAPGDRGRPGPPAGHGQEPRPPRAARPARSGSARTCGSAAPGATRPPTHARPTARRPARDHRRGRLPAPSAGARGLRGPRGAGTGDARGPRPPRRLSPVRARAHGAGAHRSPRCGARGAAYRRLPVAGHRCRLRRSSSRALHRSARSAPGPLALAPPPRRPRRQRRRSRRSSSPRMSGSCPRRAIPETAPARPAAVATWQRGRAPARQQPRHRPPWRRSVPAAPVSGGPYAALEGGAFKRRNRARARAVVSRRDRSGPPSPVADLTLVTAVSDLCPNAARLAAVCARLRTARPDAGPQSAIGPGSGRSRHAREQWFRPPRNLEEP